MHQHTKFKKTIIASAISSVLLTSTTPLLAQESSNEDQVLEEVVVTGIRSSLKRSMDTKRDSAGVVDAISAEDIGKFPDSNLAESLQRITGVAIDRVNGEGSSITVRGFGSEFNMITLNGRTIPGGGVFGGENLGAISGSTRAFDFANLASEGVSGVDVYKTGRASIATGGIGASVNIKTNRPLDTRGLKFTTGVKAVMDTSNERGSDITPELSSLISWSDDDGKFGVGLSVSRQERDSASRGIFNNTWRIARWGVDDPLYSFAPNAVIENAPEVGQLYGRSNDVRYTFADRERTRTNGQLTLQYAPTENITATVDYTYAKNELFERRGESTSWFNNSSSITNVIFDNSEVASPLFISESSGVRDHAYQQGVRGQDNTLKSFGLNLEWQVSDRLSLEFDAHDTTMDSLPSGPNGTSEVLAAFGLATQIGQSIDYRGGIPIVQVPLNDGPKGNGNGIVDAPDLASQIGRVYYKDQTNDLSQVRINGSYEFENGNRFNFGVDTREMKMGENSSRRQMTLGNWGQNFPGDVPANLVEPFNYADYEDFNTEGSFGVGFRGNAEDILQALVNTYGTAENGYCVCIDPNFSVSDVVEEETQSIYGEYAFSGELGGKPFNTLIGVRYEETDVTSTSRQRVLRYLQWDDNNDFTEVLSNDAQFVTEKASYDNVLPSIDFDISLTDDLLFRASYSKTIARTSYSNLKASVSGYDSGGGSVLLGAQPTARSSNPSLLPLESDNFDLSIEWYYDDSSYVSAGLFQKSVENFVGSENIVRNLFGVRDVTSGPRVQAAAQALRDRGFSVDDSSLFTMAWLIETGQGADAYTGSFDQQVVAGASDVNLIPNGDDPLAQFSVSTPVNNKTATIDGIELAIQHFFGDSGFGVAANYTIVSGDIGFNNNADPGQSQFALLGLSDTANLVGIYEKGPLQARIAYNWRDSFLNESARSSFNNPVYVDSYSQIDINVSYDVNENLTVFFEGLNVTGENRRDFGRSRTMIESLEDLGARYHLGARYTF